MSREKGYVIGQRALTESKTNVWRVVVDDSNSPQNTKKFQVETIQNNLELITGLRVDFIIGRVGRKSKEVALDVRPIEETTRMYQIRVLNDQQFQDSISWGAFKWWERGILQKILGNEYKTQAVDLEDLKSQLRLRVQDIWTKMADHYSRWCDQQLKPTPYEEVNVESILCKIAEFIWKNAIGPRKITVKGSEKEVAEFFFRSAASGRAVAPTVALGTFLSIMAGRFGSVTDAVADAADAGYKAYDELLERSSGCNPPLFFVGEEEIDPEIPFKQLLGCEDGNFIGWVSCMDTNIWLDLRPNKNNDISCYIWKKNPISRYRILDALPAIDAWDKINEILQMLEFGGELQLGKVTLTIEV